MKFMAKAIAGVPPHPNNPWDKRIVLGCWAVSHRLESSIIHLAAYEC